MPLSSGSPPSHSSKVFREWVARHHTAAKTKRVPKQGYPNKVSTPAPQRVFVLTIPQVIAGEGIRNARRVAWRHFGFGPASKKTVSAEILIAGKSHRVARTYGSKPTSIISRTLAVLTRKHSRSKRYDGISLIKIPPLLGLAVWVRGRNTKEDLIFPLQSAVPELQTGTTHKYVDALPLLQRSAKALVAQSLALNAKLGMGRAE